MIRATHASRLSGAATLALFVVVAGCAALAKGQDANWDLQNYHFYDPWALVHGRLLGFDVVAAQLQTFHNPALDLVFYAMIAADWPPRVAAFVLAMPAGIAAFFLLHIVEVLFAGHDSTLRKTLRVAAFAIGITGAIGWAVLGTTMNEWPIAALVLAALWVLVRAIVSTAPGLPVRALVIAGVIAGVASGLKLTAATFAVAICFALLLRHQRFRMLPMAARDAAWFGAGVAGGLAASIGWWCALLWSHFGNPVFPYLNEWFHSPWWYAAPVLERAFGPFTIEGWLSFPYDLFRPRPFFAAEVPYRDARVPALYTLALVAGAVSLTAFVASAAMRRRARSEAQTPWPFIATFWLVAFILWTAQHSIYRYMLPLELLSGALIVGLAYRLVRSRALPVVVTILALTIIGTTRWPDWGHVAFGERWFDVRAPRVAPGAMVVLASDAPIAYMLPFLGENARYVGAYNSLIRPEHETMLNQWAESAIRDHAGPLYSLAHDDAMASSAYAAHKLAVVPGSCAPVQTNMPGATVSLCKLVRMEMP